MEPPPGDSRHMGQPPIRDTDGRITGYIDRKRFGPICLRAPDVRILGTIEGQGIGATTIRAPAHTRAGPVPLDRSLRYGRPENASPRVSPAGATLAHTRHRASPSAAFACKHAPTGRREALAGGAVGAALAATRTAGANGRAFGRVRARPCGAGVTPAGGLAPCRSGPGRDHGSGPGPAPHSRASTLPQGGGDALAGGL